MTILIVSGNVVFEQFNNIARFSDDFSWDTESTSFPPLSLLTFLFFFPFFSEIL